MKNNNTLHKTSSIGLAYILSPSFSGSTLLSFLLAGHPKIATMGELKATAWGDIDEYYCSCGELIQNCDFWKNVIKELSGQGIHFDLADFGTHFRDKSNLLVDLVLRARVHGPAFETFRRAALTVVPGARKTFSRILDRNQVLIETISRLQGGSIFLDSSKDAVRLQHLMQAGFNRVRVIYLIRDGRGFVCSYMKHHNVSMDKAALEWKKTYRECQHVLRRLEPEDRLTVQYESLCRDPKNTMEKIFKFLGIEPVDIGSSFLATKQHILGNAMRLEADQRIKLDEKWRTALSSEDLKMFEHVAGDLNRKLGYV